MTVHKHPYLGFGLGLRAQHYEAILDSKPPIDWLEILSENYLVPGGRPLHYLDQFAQRYPIVMHGVSLSIGSTDPINKAYLGQLRDLIKRVEPSWISDHVCWTGTNRLNLHDLLPLPYTEEALQHVVSRVQQVQDYLGRQILLENPSSYVTFTDSPITEWEFMRALAEQADCFILLDVNNVFVSAFNHHFDAKTYIDHMPAERVVQFHIAGHTHCGTHIIDTHDAPVIEPVWELYAYTSKRFPDASTLLERDDNIPPLEVLLEELEHARTLRVDNRQLLEVAL